MSITVSELLIHPLSWRILGVGSSIVGFICYALSPSFYHLFGKLNLLKLVIYIIASLILSYLMLFVRKCRGFKRNVLVRANVGFLVVMLTSLYSVWEDRTSQQGNDAKGSHGRLLDLFSIGAFGLMALSLSRQLELGFEVGIFNFCLGTFLVILMKMNFKFGLAVGAFLCYSLMHIRSISDFLSEMRGHGDSGDTVHEDVENGFRNIHLQDRHNDSDEASDLLDRMGHTDYNTQPTRNGVTEHWMHKNRLQEYAQKSHIRLPSYNTTKEGPAHAPRFRSTVRVDGMSYTSKNIFGDRRSAEQDAAKLAFNYITTGVRDEGLLLSPEVMQAAN